MQYIFDLGDQAAAAVAAAGVPVFAWKGETDEEFWWCIEQTITGPDGMDGFNLILDDGGDLTFMHEKYPEMLKDVKGLSEETTTGVHRLYEMMKKGDLLVPAINVNDSGDEVENSDTHGCWESFVDGIKRATDVMVAVIGVVAGYGDVGSTRRVTGVIIMLMSSRGPKSIRSCASTSMEGYEVVTMEEGTIGDIFVTTTNIDVITIDHMRDKEKTALSSATSATSIARSRSHPQVTTNGTTSNHRSTKSNSPTARN